MRFGKEGAWDVTLESFVLGFRKRSGLKFHIIRDRYRNKLNTTFQKEAAISLICSDDNKREKLVGHFVLTFAIKITHTQRFLFSRYSRQDIL